MNACEAVTGLSFVRLRGDGRQCKKRRMRGTGDGDERTAGPPVIRRRLSHAFDRSSSPCSLLSGHRSSIGHKSRGGFGASNPSPISY